MQIINTFKCTGIAVEFYNLRYAELVYENGDYRIFKRFPKSFVHSYKNFAIAELTGASRKLIEVLISKEYASYPYNFVLDRAVANREKGSLIAHGLKLRCGKKKNKKEQV